MLKRIIRLIRNNLGYKILALVLAVIVWLVVINIEDPEKTEVYTVDVVFENEDYLLEQDKLYEVLNGSDQVSFTVTGKRSILDELSDSDFQATANLANIDENGQVAIQLEVLSYSSRVEVVKSSKYVSLDVYDMEKQEYEIEYEVEGTVANGYQLLGVSLSADTVTIAADPDVINKIKTVSVSINVADITDDKQVSKKIRLYDKKGRRISTEDMNLSVDKVKITADVGVTKTVPLKVKTTGKPLSGYTFVKARLSESAVTVAGDAGILETLNRIVLTGTESLSLREKSAGYTTELTIADYLPDGVVLADGASETVEVTIVIEKEEDDSDDSSD